MSRFHRETIECPYCLNEEEVVVWDYIDTALDPDLKEKVLLKQVQNYECQNCNHRYILEKPLLFRDARQKLLVYYQPAVEWEELLAERDEKGYMRWEMQEQLPLDFGFSLEEYTMRIVLDYNSFIEKIHIKDCSYQDRILEVVKLAMKTRIAEADKEDAEKHSQAQGSANENENEKGCESDDASTSSDFVEETDGQPSSIVLYFLGMENEKLLFQCYSPAKGWYQLELEEEVYKQANHLLRSYLPAEGKWDYVDALSAKMLSTFAARDLSEGQAF